jgi:hypothetical protein
MVSQLFWEKKGDRRRDCYLATELNNSVIHLYKIGRLDREKAILSIDFSEKPRRRALYLQG